MRIGPGIRPERISRSVHTYKYISEVGSRELVVEATRHPTRTCTCSLEDQDSTRSCCCRRHKSATNKQQPRAAWVSNATTKDEHIALWTHLILPIVLALLWRPTHESPPAAPSPPSPPRPGYQTQFNLKKKKGKKNSGKALTTILCFISSGVANAGKTCLFFLRFASCNERHCLSFLSAGGKKGGWPGKGGGKVLRHFSCVC